MAFLSKSNDLHRNDCSFAQLVKQASGELDEMTLLSFDGILAL